MSFLSDHELRPLTLAEGRGLRPLGLILASGPSALEVALTELDRRPTATTLRFVWKSRHKGRAAPLLLIALYDGKAALCGPAGDDPPAYIDLDPGQVERLCATALSEPDRHSALRFLNSAMPEVESPMPGVRNEGLFATHELRTGVPNRADWKQATSRATPALKARGRELVEALGFEVTSLPGPVSVLRAGATKVAVAVFLDRSESIDVTSERFSGVSPVSYALALADTEALPYVVVTAGPVIRLYSTKAGIGTGRRGRTETFVEAHLDLLPNDLAGYLWLLFSSDALTSGGSFEDILERSLCLRPQRSTA